MRGVDSDLLDGGSHSTFRSYSPELHNHADQADETKPLHVFDLPQLYQKPTPEALLQALDLLVVTPPSFEAISNGPRKTKRDVHPEGITRYLTSIIASSLAWVDEEAKEQIWELASERLSERSGRTAMASLTRSFNFPTPNGTSVSISIHEPSLTEDNLGLKTWTSSYQLSKRLALQMCPFPRPTNGHLRVLELGAGTGLVGLAFAATYATSENTPLDLHLTDLPPIVPNLAHNVKANSLLMDESVITLTTGVLDWSASPNPLPSEAEKYTIILAADPLYSPQHPPMLTQTISTYLRRHSDSRAILEMPLRGGYLAEAQDFRARMGEIGMVILEEGQEIGYDDWGSGDTEVKCWWSIWAWDGMSDQ